MVGLEKFEIQIFAVIPNYVMFFPEGFGFFDTCEHGNLSVMVEWSGGWVFRKKSAALS